MVKLRVLIVDDEAPARERLRSLLDELGNLDIAGEAATGEQALKLTVDLTPDVVLLDVRMPGMDGLEAAHQLNSLVEPPAVIFTTAYDEYAVNAFDAQAVGYLLKPIRKEKLAAALAQAGRLTRPQLQRIASTSEAPLRRTHIAARHREGLRLIPIEDVMFFFAEQKYTTVRHAKGEDLIEDSLRSSRRSLARHWCDSSECAGERALSGRHRSERGGAVSRALARVPGAAASEPPHGQRAARALPRSNYCGA